MNTQEFHEENFDPATCCDEALAAAIICAPTPLRFAFLAGVQHSRHLQKIGMSEQMREMFEDGEDYFTVIFRAATNNGKHKQ